jgi:hypothetical protein
MHFVSPSSFVYFIEKLFIRELRGQAFLEKLCAATSPLRCAVKISV